MPETKSAIEIEGFYRTLGTSSPLQTLASEAKSMNQTLKDIKSLLGRSLK